MRMMRPVKNSNRCDEILYFMCETGSGIGDMQITNGIGKECADKTCLNLRGVEI